MWRTFGWIWSKPWKLFDEKVIEPWGIRSIHHWTLPPSFSQFYYFHISNFSRLEGEADDGLYLVKTMDSAGTGIDVQEFVFLVGHDFENMRMPANIEFGRFGMDDFPNPLEIPARVPADMGDEHIDPLAFEPQIERKFSSDEGIIDVSIDSFEGFKGFQFFDYFHVADVSGVPNFIAIFKIVKNFFIQIAVGVGEKSDSFHAGKGSKTWSLT